MADTRVIDTNVLIVASAADGGSPFRPDATPVEEVGLRESVLRWMQAFEKDESRHAVLDWDWKICGEYQNKLTEQDYGWLAIMGKKDRDQVAWVGLRYDAHGHAELPASLCEDVTDLADRKMVAAVLEANARGHMCKLTNACDTDWIGCEAALGGAGIAMEHLIEHWLRKKWAEKHGSE